MSKSKTLASLVSGITSIGTGVVTALGNAVNAAGGLVTTDGTATLTNKRVTPRISSATALATSYTLNSNGLDIIIATAQNTATTISVDGGTPTDGQKLIFRIKDSGTTQTLTFSTGTGTKGFRTVGVTVPASTVAGKTMYIGCTYNAADVVWDIIAYTVLA